MYDLARANFLDLDRIDPLAKFRDRFALPKGTIYLDGNSLGALPKAAAQRVKEVTEAQWGRDLITSWNVHDWMGLPRRAGAKIAKLIGAKRDEVIVADSTSVNLFKLLAAALRLRPGRRVLLSEPGNFPTDLYIKQGLIDLLGGQHELKLVEAENLHHAIDESVAVVSLTHVNYKSGRIHDMAAITARAHEKGALILWDLAHSAGALPVALNRCRADFAVGCGYKYLNGGPGAPAFLFVAQRLQDNVRQPLTGWLGHADPFAFVADYRPAPGIDRFLCGTPPVLAMAALDAALDVFAEAPMAALRKKSMTLGDLFLALVMQECPDDGFTIACPIAAERGSQASLAHPEAYPIMQALIARGVIGDFRAPDVLRFGFTPLYVRYVDVWDAVAALKAVMAKGEWKQARFRKRARVT